MAGKRKICRVCGSEYEACNSIRKGDGIFHWREVACSTECGKEYLRRVMEARSHTEDLAEPETEEVEAEVEAEEIEVETEDETFEFE